MSENKTAAEIAAEKWLSELQWHPDQSDTTISFVNANVRGFAASDELKQTLKAELEKQEAEHKNAIRLVTEAAEAQKRELEAVTKRAEAAEAQIWTMRDKLLAVEIERNEARMQVAALVEAAKPALAEYQTRLKCLPTIEPSPKVEALIKVVQDTFPTAQAHEQRIRAEGAAEERERVNYHIHRAIADLVALDGIANADSAIGELKRVLYPATPDTGDMVEKPEANVMPEPGSMEERWVFDELEKPASVDTDTQGKTCPRCGTGEPVAIIDGTACTWCYPEKPEASDGGQG